MHSGTVLCLFKNLGPGSRSTHEWYRTREWISIALALGASALLLRWTYLGVHRYATADHLPAHYLALAHPRTGQPGVGRRLSGLVVHVGDGDNFRILHTPWLLRWWIRWRWQITGGQLPGRGTLASQTIHVRLAGIDAPECAHFGMLGQRYGPEAKAWLQRTLLNQPVRLELYQRDRFGRVIAHVWRPFRIPLFGALLPGRNVSLEMVRAGYAEVYRGAGAIYGRFQKALEAAEQRAIRRRLGMWASASASRFRNAGNISPGVIDVTNSIFVATLACRRQSTE
ncbi:putative endonuclease lcl3 [Cyanidiococcus yangmingshanensis]|uniref:Putative endonuclease lcl3 n=1 Tax=Cyanidiococcus yangmingshanensis TaxID=2690220 RepID=A0A7J7INA9_9RHOD|nr:putative endonuclease lcl3 [Cyanidiococcus yangmingshanensis]